MSHRTPSSLDAVTSALQPDGSVRVLVDGHEILTLPSNEELIAFGQTCIALGNARQEIGEQDLDRH
jgi:hypothetical protein